MKYSKHMFFKTKKNWFIKVIVSLVSTPFQAPSWVGASNFEINNIYYASIGSLSRGAPFWYVFSILVVLSLSSLWYYDACANVTPGGSDAREVGEHNAEWTVYAYVRLITCWSKSAFIKFRHLNFSSTDGCVH